MKKPSNEDSSALLKEYEDIVSKLPTRSPIYLPTEKIDIYDKLLGIKKVQDIYNNKLDTIYRPKIKDLRKKYYGHERCFLIGNGPSLNQTDLSLLKNEVTFAVNSFFLKLNEIDWIPTFYVVEDHLVAEDRKESINSLKGPIKLFPVYLAYCLDESENTIFFNHRPRKSYPYGFDFSEDASMVTYTGCTVIYSCMQLAFYMGFKSIYLVGVDSDYTIPNDIQQGKDYNVGVLDMKSDDPNHFHPDYFGKGFRWHDPQVHKMVEAYQEAKKVLNTTNHRIYNSTVGGKLEVFERVPLEQVFKKSKSLTEHEYFPKLLIIDSTRIGHASATGQIKQTFLEKWPNDLYNQIWTSGKINPETPHNEHDLHIRSSFGSSLSIENIIDKCISFDPDVIYFRPIDSDLLFNIATKVLAAIDKPLALHIMDDWPERVRKTDPQRFDNYDRMLRSVIQKASLHLSIGEAMSAAFTKRYGKNWIPLANGVDPAEFKQKVWSGRSPVSAENPFILRYNGGLAADMGFDSVTDIAMAVSELSQTYDLRFEIYTTEWHLEKALKKYKQMKGVSVAALVDSKLYKQSLSEADVLIIAYNFDEISLSYTSLSLANKLPECLVSGAVVLGYGPPQSATIDFLKKADCAKVVERRSVEDIKAVIVSLISDLDHCHEVSRKAIDFVSKNLTKKQVQDKFRDCILRTMQVQDAIIPVLVGPFEKFHQATVNELDILADNFIAAATRPVMLDLGTGTGQHLQGIAGKGWIILAFEPNPADYEKLVADFNANIRMGSVSAENKSLKSALDKDYCFYRSGQQPGSAYAFKATDAETISLEEYLTLKKLHKIDLFRIGAGIDAFSILRDIPWHNYNPDILLIECADAGEAMAGFRLHEIAELLIHRKYSVYISERYADNDDRGSAWKQLLRYPCELSETGNIIHIIAFSEPVDEYALANIFRNRAGIDFLSTTAEEEKDKPLPGEFVLSGISRFGDATLENGSYRLMPPYQSNWVGIKFTGSALPDDVVVGEVHLSISQDCTLYVTLAREGSGPFESSREKFALPKGKHTLSITHQFINEQKGIRIQIGVTDKEIEIRDIDASLVNITAKERIETLLKLERERLREAGMMSNRDIEEFNPEESGGLYALIKRFIWRIIHIAGKFIKAILRFIVPDQQIRESISVGIRKRLPNWLNRLL
ncbi:MAG: DUF115 domain-containing protein [Bacteroidales bacterium]|nr:DUF115 domain-containing protein [Bacteroidales bacterium]